MPGSSLWLIPPPNTPFTRQLNQYISATVPFRFPSSKKPPSFIPHITLTSNIPFSLHDTSPDTAQVWLDCLELPLPSQSTGEEGEEQQKIHVELCALEAGEAFFKKLTLKAKKDPGLVKLAVACRAQGALSGDFEKARTWGTHDYEPHLSLMYADLPIEEVERKVPAVLQDIERGRAIFKPARDGTVATGGSVVLVATDKEIDHWKPIASREVPGLVWKWDLK